MQTGAVLLAMLTMTTSWYGADFHGNTTANGEIYDMNARTAAHRTLPFDTLLLVSTGESRVLVRINDRGPYDPDVLPELVPHPTRQLDLSRGSFNALAPLGVGVMEVDCIIIRYGENEDMGIGYDAPF